MNSNTDDEFIPPLYIHMKRTYVEEISLIPANYYFQSETSSNYDVHNVNDLGQEFQPRNMQLAEFVVDDPEALLETSYGSRMICPENVSNTCKIRTNCDDAEEKISEHLSVDAKMTDSYYTLIFEDHCYFEKYPPADNPGHFNAKNVEQTSHHFDVSYVDTAVEWPDEPSNGILELQENFDNIVPNDNAISDMYIEDFGLNQKIFPTINEELNNDADDLIESFDDLHDGAHICPDVQVLKKTSFAESNEDQSVPDITLLSKYTNSGLNTEREFYKHCSDDSCTPHKALRVGLSKKQKVIPLHGFKF